MDIFDWFINLYFNKLRSFELFQNMGSTVENSQWHREENVLVHTDMVVSQYINKSREIRPNSYDFWQLGALAAAFHDVGKPEAMTEVFSSDQRLIRTFKGHELISARHWENFALSNWDLFRGIINARDVWAISWMIEHHLPYAIKKDHKVNNIYITARDISLTAFSNLLTADCWGRISDDHDQKKRNVDEWLGNFLLNADLMDAYESFHENVKAKKDAPTLYVLIGPSGCGKTTFSNTLPNAKIHSMDTLRLEWYGSDYSEAFKKSCDDETFTTKVQKHFMDLLSEGHSEVIVDNTNLSTKRRRFYIDAASRKGYKTVGVVFPISLDNLLTRQLSRSDKHIPRDVVKNHYQSVQQPSYGEFDEIIFNSFDK